MAPSSVSSDIATLLAGEGSKRGKMNLARLESRRILHLAAEGEGASPSRLTWPGLGDILPDGELPRGVVELAAPRMLGGATAFALTAVRAGQAREAAAWSAWVDPEATLHAPGVVAAGVDPARMLVVRPPRDQLTRTAVKIVASGAFEVVVVDCDPIAGAASARPPGAAGVPPLRSPELFVRKLALAAEPSATTVLLLTDSTRPRAAVWPVALRLELARPTRLDLSVRIAKDRRGRGGLVKIVPFRSIGRAG